MTATQPSTTPEELIELCRAIDTVLNRDRRTDAPAPSQATRPADASTVPPMSLLIPAANIEKQFDRECPEGFEGTTIAPPKRTDVPASLYTVEPMGDQFDPTPLYWIVQAQEGKIELELEDDRRWYLHVAGQEVDVDAGMLRDLVRVLQRPEVRTALLLME